MVLFTVLTISCERDTWLTDMESRGSGEPVNVLLSFEVPNADEVAVTRTMSELEEHNVKDLYVLIFDAEDGDHGFPLISRQYFDENALNVTKVNHANGEWSSVLDGDGNSTHGVVMAKALEKNCFVFGIANVRGMDSEVARSEETTYSKLDDALLAMKTVSPSESSPTTLADFYNLQSELKNNISLGRNDAHLLMSGVFVPIDKYQPDGYDDYDRKYQRGVAGLVDIGQENIIADLKDDNGNVDLTKAGVIRLRRVASHITFKIKINNRDLNNDGKIDDNDKLFSDFKPESWRVLHLPNKSYLMDQGNEKLKITGDENFSNSDAQKTMIHVDANYKFDFYMYENHKEARAIGDGDIVYLNTEGKGWDEMSVDNKSIVTSYYLPQFGYSIIDVDTKDGEYCQKLSSDVYNNDEHAFQYAKRELALKDDNGDYILNDDGTKQFVYIEPNATYVEIKGRLLFNTDLFQLTDLIKRGGVDRSTTEAVKNGYADVTYLIHLGYARGRSIRDEVKGTGSVSDDYKMCDFNSLRNTEYTYNIEIQGVNSIFTQVVTESPDDTDKRESAKLQPGASGFIGMVSESVFNTDAHFNSFNIFLDVNHLDVDNFFFEINTPWSVIQSSEMNDTDYNNTTTSRSYKFNPDLTWVKVRRNLDQTLGGNKDFVNYVGTEHRTTMPYFKEQGNMSNETYESTYHFNSNPLIDLYQLKKELTKLSTVGLPITIKEGSADKSYTAKLDTETVSGSPVKVLNYYDGSSKVGSLQGLFYTVYLDEYYYHTPPVGASWRTPYWHEFVNTPARYVSFGTNAVVNTGSTHDHESSMMKPQLMIVQPSIQSHYATDGDIIVGLGMEHYNETPHPRWADNGPAGSIGTSFKGDKKKFGWLNAQDYVVNNSKVVKWDDYVADYVGKYNNLTMKPNDKNGTVSVPAVNFLGSNDNDAQYMAGAIRLCMNRNRDENGNGKIDENELKWYLPASSQLDIISMCHYSFYDPLLNYNDYLYGTDDEGHVRYRLKNFEGTYAQLVKNDGSNDMRGGNFYYQHFVTSDYMKLTSEEMMNLNNYNTYGTYIYNPGEMRCVRNLGEVVGDAHSGKNVLKPYSVYNSDGTVSMYLDRTELQTYTGAEPNVMFEFKHNGIVTKNGRKVYTGKVFVMEKYMDSRSVRTAKYENEELPPHYLFSEINRPYKAFQVAETELRMDFGIWKKKFGNSYYLDLEDIYLGRPCGEYWEETDPDDPSVHPDKGSWRAPNAAEISLMIHQLRVTNGDGNAQDSNSDPYYFFEGTSPYPFTCTSWNFAGKLWVRMVAIKSNSSPPPRKLWMSDPYKVTSTSVGQSFKFDDANKALYSDGVRLRCVKDIEPPL